MNTADRSLAQIDYALRRRFYFVRFMPVENGRTGRSPRTGSRATSIPPPTASGSPPVRHAEPSDRAPSGTDDLQVGHSYFMQDGIETEIVFDRVWIRAVRPLLEEYLHHHRQRDEILADLTPARLLPMPNVQSIEVEDQKSPTPWEPEQV